MDCIGVAELWSAMNVDDEPKLSIDYGFVFGTLNLAIKFNSVFTRARLRSRAA